MARRVALITGGASGIGRAAAEHLVGKEWKVVILDRDVERGTEAAKSLQPHALFIEVDLADYWQQARAFSKAFEWGKGRLDVFFANAGIADTASPYKDVAVPLLTEDGLPPPLNLDTLRVDLDAVIQGIWLFRHFRKGNQADYGHVIVTSSAAGIYANYTLPIYSAAKHALVGYVRAVAPVLAQQGIAVNAILPTLIETNLMPPQYRSLVDTKELTPMSTALRALDMLINDQELVGETLELSLDEIVFRARPKPSTANQARLGERMDLWEYVSEQHMPMPPGQNLR